jgi:Flp pilus assembly protein TadG
VTRSGNAGILREQVMRKMREFVHDQRGGPTIEFVVLVPAFMFFLLLTVDTSILLLTRTEMFNLARTTARQISVGEISIDDAPAYVNKKILLAGRTYTLGTLSGALVVVQISVNVGDASVFGFFTPILGRTMTARVQMRREPTYAEESPPAV